MADKTRLILLRSLFLACCLSPTIVVMSWAVGGNTPRHNAQQLRHWQRMLAEQLDVNVEIDSVDQVDSIVVLNGVKLFDKEHSHLLVQANQVTIYPGDAVLQLVVSHPQIVTSHLDLMHSVMTSIQRRALTQPIVVDARQCILSGSDARTLTDLRLQIRQADTRAVWDMSFRVAGVESETKSRLQVLRERGSERPLTSWALVTGSAPLPASVAWSLLPQMRSLGPACSFRGKVVSQQFARGSRRLPEGGRVTELSGTFEKIELDRIFRPFFYHFTGEAELFLQSARIEGTRLTRANGNVKCGGGTIGGSFLQAAAEALKLPTDRRFADSQARHPYSNLGIRFQIQHDSMSIAGLGTTAPGALSPAVLYSGEGLPTPLLGGRSTGLIPAVAVSDLLNRKSARQVAATKQGYKFLKHLPIPAIKRPPGWEKIKPRTTIRVERP